MQILLPSGNPILLMLWVAISFGSWYTYFFYLPTLYADGDKPGWLQVRPRGGGTRVGCSVGAANTSRGGQSCKKCDGGGRKDQSFSA